MNQKERATLTSLEKTVGSLSSNVKTAVDNLLKHQKEVTKAISEVDKSEEVAKLAEKISKGIEKYFSAMNALASDSYDMLINKLTDTQKENIELCNLQSEIMTDQTNIMSEMNKELKDAKAWREDWEVRISKYAFNLTGGIVVLTVLLILHLIIHIIMR